MPSSSRSPPRLETTETIQTQQFRDNLALLEEESQVSKARPGPFNNPTPALHDSRLNAIPNLDPIPYFATAGHQERTKARTFFTRCPIRERDYQQLVTLLGHTYGADCETYASAGINLDEEIRAIPLRDILEAQNHLEHGGQAPSGPSTGVTPAIYYSRRAGRGIVKASGCAGQPGRGHGRGGGTRGRGRGNNQRQADAQSDQATTLTNTATSSTVVARGGSPSVRGREGRRRGRGRG